MKFCIRHRAGITIVFAIAEVAQLVEQGFCKPQVAGSNPVLGSIKLLIDFFSLGRCRSSQTDQTVNLAAFSLRRCESSSPHHFFRRKALIPVRFNRWSNIQGQTGVKAAGVA